MEEKLSPLFSVKEMLSEEEASKMGRKNPDEEVEKFVSANTQELGKDKWLCPLSGKKFKVSPKNLLLPYNAWKMYLNFNQHYCAVSHCLVDFHFNMTACISH